MQRQRPGAVFTPAELVQARIGPEQAVRQALSRFASNGTIRRIAKGYYDVPRVNARIGPLSPTPEAIVAAHARKTGAIIERPAIDAANSLGLSTQVTARPVYRTNLFRATSISEDSAFDFARWGRARSRSMQILPSS